MNQAPRDPRLAHIRKVDLTPWNPVKWIVRAHIVFMGAMTAGTLWLSVITPLRAPFILKAIVVAGGLAQVVFFYSLFMWVRYHRGIYVESFWGFVRGPQPQDEDERRLWVWGRRCHRSWLFILGSIALLLAIGLVTRIGE